jgi:hypothetical protein
MQTSLSADVCMQTEAYICTRNLMPAGTNGVALCVYQLDHLVHTAIITKELVVVSTTVSVASCTGKLQKPQAYCINTDLLY